MTLGQHIAQKRRELGLSQEQLSQEMGVSRQAIYKWESDATVPEIDKLIALSDGQTVEVEAQGQQSFEGKIACPLSGQIWIRSRNADGLLDTAEGAGYQNPADWSY